MTHEPLVSIVIPTYNCAEFLLEALDSACKQTYGQTEIIIVDDGSTDNTRDVIARYLERPNVRYVYQENQGLPAARNTGVRAAKGEYIAALDADDALHPEALQKMLSATLAAGAHWCLIDILRICGKDRRVERTVIPQGDLLLGILKTNFITRAMFIRRDTLLAADLWDPEMKNLEDWDLNIRLLERREPFAYVPEPLYLYRKRPGSITTVTPVKIINYFERLARKHSLRLCRLGMREARPVYAAAMWQIARRRLYERRQYRQAFACAFQSFRYEMSLSRILRGAGFLFTKRIPKTFAALLPGAHS